MATKNLLPTVTTLFLLLLTLTSGDTDSDLVLDADGNPLEAGSQYSIRPTSFILAGIGRSGRDGTSLSCPLYVIDYPGEIHGGDPLKFIPVNETQKEIHVSSDVKVDSGFSAYCRDDGLWRLDYDVPNRRFVVIASGIFNQPRASFRIEKTGVGPIPSYTITISSVEQTLGQQAVYYLTLFIDSLSGMRMVGLTVDPNEALGVNFFKVNKDVAASI